jgi:hypothetical protein
MARARRVCLFQREIKERLSAAALEILLGGAKVLSEGQSSGTGKAARYYGSSMLTIDLTSFSRYIRDPLDAASAVRVAAMIETDSSIKKRLAALARVEAERIAKRKLTAMEMEMDVCVECAKVLVDLDVEAGGIGRRSALTDRQMKLNLDVKQNGEPDRGAAEVDERGRSQKKR